MKKLKHTYSTTNYQTMDVCNAMDQEKQDEILKYVEDIRNLIIGNADPNGIVQSEYQSLHFIAACRKGFLKEAQWILQNWNVDPYCKNNMPFSWAISAEQWEIVLWILHWEHPQDQMNGIIYQVEKIPRKAAECNRLDIVKEALQWLANKEINTTAIVGGALSAASEKGHLETAQWLYDLKQANTYVLRVCAFNAARANQRVIVEWFLTKMVITVPELLYQLEFWQQELYNAMEKRINNGQVTNRNEYGVHIQTIAWLKSKLPPEDC